MKQKHLFNYEQEEVNDKPLPKKILIGAWTYHGIVGPNRRPLGAKQGTPFGTLNAVNSEDLAHELGLVSWPQNRHGTLEECCEYFCRVFEIDHTIIIPFEEWMFAIDCDPRYPSSIAFEDSGIVERLRLDKYGVSL